MLNNKRVKRTEEIDFLKCVLIMAVIILHIVYIGDTFPMVKKFILTFTMPTFIFISGYLVNVDKKPTAFIRSTIHILTPYLIMETCYIIMAHHLPIREHIDILSTRTFLQYLLVHPVGPYWYLHTLILCNSIYYIINYFTSARNKQAKQSTNEIRLIIALGSVFTLVSAGFNLLSAIYAIYYTAGIVIRRNHIDIRKMLNPTLWTIIPIIISFYFRDNIDCINIYGILFNGSMICFLLWVYHHLPTKIRKVSLYIGTHTLPIYLFSPAFTFCANKFSYMFTFDPTGTILTITAISISVIGGIILYKLFKKSKMTSWLLP